MHEQISLFLQDRIDAGDFPSAVYLIAGKGEVIYKDALGHAVVEPQFIAAACDTIYDLASLTKPLVTGLLAALLIENGELKLDSVTRDFFRTHGLDWRQTVTVGSLLSHTSDLPAWKPFYLNVHNPSDITEYILHTPLDANKTAVTYSDLNFMLLSHIVMNRMCCPFDQVARLNIFDPLGLTNTFFNPGRALRSRIAASEKGNEYEKQTCIEQGYLSDWTASIRDAEGSEKRPASAVPDSDGPPADASIQNAFRNYQIWGEVHDGNAYFMGGVAGHAGLFSTAEEIFKIAKQFLPNYTTILKPKTCELFQTNFTKGMNEDRSFAFQLASSPESTAGTNMALESFGHNGFTGTSLWIDPIKERIFILLTNRTHNHPLPFININAVRRRFHDLAIDLLDQNS